MNEEGAIIAVVGMLCGTGMMVFLIHSIRAMIVRRAEPGLRDEVRLLREEIQQLRQENRDLMLSFDTAIAQVDRRLDRMEARPHSGLAESPLIAGRH